MSRIFQLPQQVPIVGGAVSPGAKANFYLTGTTTKTNTYTDAALTIPSANPVVADAAGVFEVIYLDPDVVYRLVLNDASDSLIYDEDPIQDQLTQANIGLILYPRTAAEISAGVTPVDYSKEPGNVLRYGENTVPGTTDMSTAAQAALDSNDEIRFTDGIYIATGLTASSNQKITLDAGATLRMKAGTVTGSYLLQINGKTNVEITGGILDGNYANMSAQKPPVIQLAGNSSIVDIHGCQFIDPPDRCIDFTVSTNTITDVSIHHNFFDHGGEGESVLGANNSARTGTCKRIFFHNNICMDVETGVRMFGVDDWSVNDNFIYNTSAIARECVAAFNGATNLTIANNTLVCLTHDPFAISMGIETITWKNMNITGNTMVALGAGATFNAEAVELVVRDGGSVDGCVISDNTIEGFYYGITASIDASIAGTYGWDNLSITGNSINTLHRCIGLVVDSSTATTHHNGVTISGNACKMTNKASTSLDIGIQARDWNANHTCSNVVITGNTVKDAYYGIYTDATYAGKNILVNGNIVRDCVDGLLLKGDTGRIVNMISTNNISENNSSADYTLSNFALVDGCIQTQDHDSSGLRPALMTTFAADDTTPSVANSRICLTQANTGATALTQLDGGRAGQEVIILGKSNTNATTIADGGNFALTGAITLNNYTSIILTTNDGTEWTEVSRSVN